MNLEGCRSSSAQSLNCTFSCQAGADPKEHAAPPAGLDSFVVLVPAGVTSWKSARLMSFVASLRSLEIEIGAKMPS